MSDLDSFLPDLPESIIGRALIADYLLGKGYLLCDLQYLATEDAEGLYKEACQFARREANIVAPVLPLERYNVVGFSLN